jgi:hypothetical protein
MDSADCRHACMHNTLTSLFGSGSHHYSSPHTKPVEVVTEDLETDVSPHFRLTKVDSL